MIPVIDRALYFVEKALSNIRQAPLVNLLTVSTIGVALLLFGLFLAVTQNLSMAVESWGHGLTISLYLKDEVSTDEARTFAESLEARAAVGSVRVVSAEEALERLRRSLGEQSDVLAGLDGESNPLPATIELTLAGEPSRESLARHIAEWQARSEVDEVVYGREWVEGLVALVQGLRLGGIVLGSLLFLAAVAIVSNTIKLAVYARREEIGVMKLVGATDAFVRLPFVIEGVLQGFFGAGTAVLMLYGLHRLALPRAAGVVQPILGNHELVFLPPAVVAYLILGGALLGLLGSVAAVGRHLRV